jgi:hypothetical protein
MGRDDPQPGDPKWHKHSVPLPAGHKWQCKPGNHLFIADRGAISFEIPRTWITIPDRDGTIRIHDRKPPKDSARLSLSLFRLPPIQGGWSQELPLEQMFRMALDRGKEEPGPHEIKRLPRIDAEILWVERPGSPDPENGRLIRCRQLMGRANLVQPFITFEFYDDRSSQFLPVWNDVLQSLKVGVPRDITGETTN